MAAVASVELVATGGAGRMATLALSGAEGDLRIHSVNLHHTGAAGRARDIRMLRRASRVDPQAYHVILCGCNFVLDGGDSMDPMAASGRRTVACEDMAAWNASFSEWTDLLQPEVTHRGREGGT